METGVFESTERLVMREEPIEYFVRLLESGIPFSMAGFSDAEWYCILRKRLGSTTGLGQTIDGGHGTRLANVIRERYTDSRFRFAIPKCLWQLPEFEKHEIDIWLQREHIERFEFYERDMLTDELAQAAGLYPLVNQLRKMHTVIIGNEYLREIDFLGHRHFIEISSPNLHKKPGGIKQAVLEAKNYGTLEGPAVYLVSAGVSAATIIHRLHDELLTSTLIDCGSIWDAFVGIGGQREWRRQLYADPEKLLEWKGANLNGTSYTPPESREDAE